VLCLLAHCGHWLLQTTLLGLLNAASHTKFRDSARQLDLIRDAVETKWESIMGAAAKVIDWLHDGQAGYAHLPGFMNGKTSIEATFLEDGPLGFTFGCDDPSKPPYISSIQQDSPAARAPGLLLKMPLLAVNGQETDKWAFDDILSLISSVRPMRLTFGYQFRKSDKHVARKGMGIHRVRYNLWRMVGTKLRQQLGDLVQLLEKQVSAYDVLYKGGGDIDRKQHLEQVLELVKTLDSTKSPLGKLLKPQPDYNTKEIKLQGELLPLHRPSHHWKPRGLPALTRRSILTKLQRLEAPGHGFKVLVADESAVKALASYVTADELTCEAGVVLVEKLSAERRSLDLLDAVYVVEPTSWNVEQIRADFELERAKYHRAHVLFLTDFVADNVRTKLQRDLGSHLASIGFLRADFQTAGPNSFHFGIHDAHSLMTSSVNGYA
jgi:hypothetical protein